MLIGRKFISLKGGVITKVLPIVFIVLFLLAVWVIFFPPSFGGVKAVMTNGEQQLNITVESSYTPEKVVVKAGIPVRMKFNVTGAAVCSKIIVSSTLGIPVTQLKDGQEVVFTPAKKGDYNITCTHGMYYLGVQVTA